MASGTKSWNNISPRRTLSSSAGSGDTTLNLSGSTTDYPAVPFSARITDANDAAIYEVVLCTAKSGTTATVTRGYDGTTAQSFASGSFFEHTVIGEDLNDVPYPDAANTFSAAQTFSHATTPILLNIIAERTAASGVTVDGTLLKDGGVTATGASTFSGTSVFSGAATFSSATSFSSASTFSSSVTAAHSSGVTTDTITERTAAAGVTADGVLLKDAGVTASGSSTFSGTTLFSGTAKCSAAFEQGYTDDGNVGATTTINLSGGNVHKVTMTASITSLTLSGSTSGKACSLTLLLVQDGTGSRTVTWPSSVKWPSATAPTLSTGANKVDVVTLVTVDGGTTWYSFSVGLDVR